MGRLKNSQFKFRKNDDVGKEGAEQDHAYLEDCYYDRGDLDVIRDCTNPACVIVGRTGSGKTALLLKLQDEQEHIISVEPESLSLQFLSNSTILPQLESLGVNLGLFYKLLWRHIFAVELIKAKYGMRTEMESGSFMQWLMGIFGRDRKKERAIKYLRDWGEEFWKDTEYRVKEVTSKLESNLKDAIGIKLPAALEASTSSVNAYSLEEKAEIVSKAQAVVNEIQVRELNEVLTVLGESVFDNDQQRFYVLLDRLDEGWIDDHFRYRLIRALIEAVKELNHRIKGVKMVVAIRRDLLDRVIHETRDAGFQEEKYEPLIINLKWTREQLFDMLNMRVDKLIARRYTGGHVSWIDVMPTSVNKQRTEDYLIERTMYRPRDMIVFFNLCIEQATGKPEITAQMVIHAEGQYSEKRLRSLLDEWHAEFPELEACVPLLRKLPPHFRLDAIDEERIAEVCLSIATSAARNPREIFKWATQMVEGKLTPGDFRARLAVVFYRVGLIGLKMDPTSAVSWSFRHSYTVPEEALKDETPADICPVFFRALGINPAAQGQRASKA